MFYDLIYFGYTWNKNSQKYEKEFIEEITKKFPNIKLNNAYDNIKGYRQEISLEESENDNYWAWIIAHGWIEFSLIGSFMLMGENEKEKLQKYINLAKEQYPQNFKS